MLWMLKRHLKKRTVMFTCLFATNLSKMVFRRIGLCLIVNKAWNDVLCLMESSSGVLCLMESSSGIYSIYLYVMNVTKMSLGHLMFLLDNIWRNCCYEIKIFIQEFFSLALSFFYDDNQSKSHACFRLLHCIYRENQKSCSKKAFRE